MPRRVQALLDAPFGIVAAGRKLEAVRISLALVLLLWVVLGPFPVFYPDERALLYDPQGIARLIPSLDRSTFEGIRALVVIGALAMLLPMTRRAGTIVAAMAFFVLNGFVSAFSALWNYNTHLNLFLVLLCFTPHTERLPERAADSRASAILFAMRFQVGVIYLQTGLAKLVLGGLYWPLTTPYVHLVVQNGFASQWLAVAPKLVAGLGYLVVLTELALPILLLMSRTARLGVALAVALHLSFYALLGIGFWHLWMLFPAIFLYNEDVAASASRTRTGRGDKGRTADRLRDQ